MRKLLTLCVIRKGNRVLLGQKKRGFGVGLWNGYGGKVEEGETIEESLLRETEEEAGIVIKEFEKIGLMNFHLNNEPNSLEVHIFNVFKFEGEPVETEEMKPQWFSIEDIPYSAMWADDIYWYPLFLEGKKFKGEFFFDEEKKVKDYNLEEVESL